MDWLFELHSTNPTAQAIATLALVAVGGMALGSLQLRGVKLGSSGVLFVGLIAGHFGEPIDHHTLEFVKEFGLILFVFCIGLYLGPGFFASLRQSGLKLNGLAFAIVLLGALAAVGMGWLMGFDSAAVLGIFSGASTNTPSLGAAQQTLTSFPGVSSEREALPALAYAVTYPFGILGIIATLLVLKNVFRIDVAAEVAAHHAASRQGPAPLERRTLVVENPNLAGLALRDLPGLVESGAVISRVRSGSDGSIVTATGGRHMAVGDGILAVGTAKGLDVLERVVGSASPENLIHGEGVVTERKLVVTSKEVLGKTIGELNLDAVFGVVVTRVTRGDLQFTAVPSFRLQFGDVLRVVGPEESLSRTATLVGNSLQALDETQFIPFFAGIGAGIALGTLPIPCPGLPQPLKLGLAAGPLLVAILVGRLGRIGPLVWHIPRNANVAFREFGISLFFAAVGLLAGPKFFVTAFSTTGAMWLLAGLIVTIVPLFLVGVLARVLLAMNYVELAGLLAGSMTDPPALAFANGVCQSEAPAVAYATVYPLTMLLRIIAAQALAVLLCG